MKRLIFPILVMAVLVTAGPAMAQQVTGETEVGTDSEAFFSQYFFVDWDHANVLARYFWVEGVLERGEFAIGPTFNFGGGNIVKFQVGGTTDKQVMAGGLFILHAASRDFMYVLDGKFATQKGEPHTLYQKLWLPMSQSQKTQLRIEALQIGSEYDFLRLGIEMRYGSATQHFFAAPWYDPLRVAIGGQVGVRF